MLVYWRIPAKTKGNGVSVLQHLLTKHRDIISNQQPNNLNISLSGFAQMLYDNT